MVLVWLGGTLGTGSRFLVGAAVPRVADVPVATVGINVLGAFLLGLLLTQLARSAPDLGRRPWARLLLGTGFLGGFTTYSALAVDAAVLGQAGRVGMAAAYAIGTLVLGAAASFAGMVLAGRVGT